MVTHSRGKYTPHKTGRYNPTNKQAGAIVVRGNEAEHPVLLKNPRTLKQLIDYLKDVPE